MAHGERTFGRIAELLTEVHGLRRAYLTWCGRRQRFIVVVEATTITILVYNQRLQRPVDAVPFRNLCALGWVFFMNLYVASYFVRKAIATLPVAVLNFAMCQ